MIRCPTLVVEIPGNTALEEGQGERFISLVPHAQLRHLPYRPRTAWLEDFATAIESFDEELDGAPGVPDAHGLLSEREAEVLRLVAAGQTNPQIAEALVLSEATVKSHIAHIYAKLGVRNRAEATRWALTHGVDRGPAANAARY
jgi:DNA-binding NarL/FixJ family response regulator